MQTHNFTQGSLQWLAYRREHFNASDAPAMMGMSPYKQRAALLQELRTGIAPDVSASTQYLFDRGHRFEAQSRQLAESILGEDLFPVVGSLGRLSASFDGLTMDETTAWEHKTLNADLRACFKRMESLPTNERELRAGYLLPIYHRAQMEQQLHVSGAGRVLFTASTWADDGSLVEAVHCWYHPDEELRAEILNGWAQFERDLANYAAPVSAPTAPTGHAPETLPALRIEVSGQVTASNLAEFKSTALALIRGVRRELSTDQDFADAEASVKWCGEVETRLAAAKQHALSQTETIDALFRTIDDISAEARKVRLDLDKLVKARKETIRGEIVSAGHKAYEAHERALRAETGGAWISLPPPDLAAAIKSLRTVDSIRNAVDTAIAKAKIAADESARRIRESLRILGEDGKGFEFLFADKSALIGKAPDDLRLLVKSRIDAHQAAEAARLEAERERIRAEEQAKAQRAAERERTELAAQTIVMAERERAQAVQAAPVPAPSPAGIIDRGESPAGQALVRAMAAPPPPAAANEPATLNLGAICARLGFTVNAAFVTDVLKVAPAETVKAAKLYRESDLTRICAALVQHVAAVARARTMEPA